MKRLNEYGKIKFGLFFYILLCILFLLFFVMRKVNGQTSNTLGGIGYHVVYSIDYKKLKPVKTTSITEVYTILNLVCPNNCINIESGLNEQPYICIDIYKNYFYVEKKRITNKGKYKRLKLK